MKSAAKEKRESEREIRKRETEIEEYLEKN
jgi:hypothetical protein